MPVDEAVNQRQPGSKSIESIGMQQSPGQEHGNAQVMRTGKQFDGGVLNFDPVGAFGFLHDFSIEFAFGGACDLYLQMLPLDSSDPQPYQPKPAMAASSP